MTWDVEAIGPYSSHKYALIRALSCRVIQENAATAARGAGKQGK